MESVFQLPTHEELLIRPGAPFIHRDLSWVSFNQRVLDEALDAANPLAERLKFLAISSSNLDEFFMIRISSLITEIQQKLQQDRPDEVYLLNRIKHSLFAKIDELSEQQESCLEELADRLAEHNVFLHLDDTAGEHIFREEIFPKLPNAERFSLLKLNTLKNLQSAWIALDSDNNRSLWCRIPKGLSPIYLEEKPEGLHVYFRDQLILNGLRKELDRSNSVLIRMTRDGDLPFELDGDDLRGARDKIELSVSIRDGRRPMRLQILGALSADALHSFANALRLESFQVFRQRSTALFHSLWTLVGYLAKNRANDREITLPAIQPKQLPNFFSLPKKLLEKITERDRLLHHPYDSFDGVIKFIEAICEDPSIDEVSMTLYRLDKDSIIPSLLVKARKAGKRVRVFVELRARFDEVNNLRWSEYFRENGVDVFFGFGRLKLHAKITLAMRSDGSGFVHLGTGNYHRKNAKIYTDLSLLTARDSLVHDARSFLRSIESRERPTSLKSLVPAPTRLHRRMLSLIEQEKQAAISGNSAEIFVKVNALVDQSIIEHLYSASQAGVRVTLMVRGACSLIPGVPGLSDKIRVFRIVDRYLEHSRIYYFKSAQKMYLSSADWMQRNFFSRLEIAFPVEDPQLFEFLEREVLQRYLADNDKSRELMPSGDWKRAHAGLMTRHAQGEFTQMALRNYQSTSLENMQS